VRDRIHRVGALFPASEIPGARILVEAMAKRGFIEGRNLAFDFRSANGQPDLFPQLARELVAGRPDVIVSSTVLAARALIAMTQEIPIVLAGVGDPVAVGLTKSIARPSGNVTGFTTGFDTVAAKRLQLLHEMVPAARRVAALSVAGNANHQVVVELLRQAASTMDVEILSLLLADDDDITPSFARAESARAEAILVLAEPMTIRNRRTIIDECVIRNWPAMHNYAFEVRDGALMSYGGEVGEDYTRSADYVARILRGTKVADLPFQEPTRFTLAINLRTAREIGMTVPPMLLARADEVIE
jgi:putative ABC transport system substrate-binding protein